MPGSQSDKLGQSLVERGLAATDLDILSPELIRVVEYSCPVCDVEVAVAGLLEELLPSIAVRTVMGAVREWLDGQSSEQLAAPTGNGGARGSCGRRLSVGGCPVRSSVTRPDIRASFEASHVSFFQRTQAGRIDGRTVARRSGQRD